MFFVHVHIAAFGFLGERHLLLELLIDLTTTEGRDLELHRVDLIAEVSKLANQSLIAATCKVAGLIDRKRSREGHVFENLPADRRALELLVRLPETRLFSSRIATYSRC